MTLSISEQMLKLLSFLMRGRLYVSLAEYKASSYSLYIILTLYIYYVQRCFSEFQLQMLTKEVKSTMRHAYAEGSFNNLRIQWKSYFIFCEYFSLPALPARVDILCTYARFLGRSFKSVSSIRNYLSAIKVLHTILELDYPTAELIHLRLLLRGLARENPHVPKKALPITPEILRDIYNLLNFDTEIDNVYWAAFFIVIFYNEQKIQHASQ